MPLELVVDSLDKVAEPLRAAYVERDGKFHLDAPIEDVSGLKRSRDTVLAEKKAAEARLAKIESVFGERKLEDIEALLKKQQDDEGEKGSEADKRARREKALRDEFAAQLKPLQEKAAKLEEKEYEEQVWAAAKAAGALDSDRKLVLKMAKGDYVTRDSSGKIIVVDEYGEPTSDDLKTLFEGRFKKENAKLYQATAGSGGGANGGGSGSRAANGKVNVTDAAGILANLDKVAKGQIAFE